MVALDTRGRPGALGRGGFAIEVSINYHGSLYKFQFDGYLRGNYFEI